MLLLARTTPYDELKDKTQGLSVFIVDMREATALSINTYYVQLIQKVRRGVDHLACRRQLLAGHALVNQLVPVLEVDRQCVRHR